MKQLLQNLILFITLFLLSTSSAEAALNYHVLKGTNYSHYQIVNCNLNDTGIIFTYHQSGVRGTVQSQLATMRSNGVETLRIIIWHMSDIGTQRWGVVPSAGGVISEPYRTNLINYLTDVRVAGYARLTVSFGPQWTNLPIADNYDPVKFAENWSFIQDVRTLVKQYGPSDTRIDLLNEGGPSIYQPSYQRVTDYDRQMYINYVFAFGKSDVTISYIGPTNSNGAADRLQNLINIFNSTGYGQPNWYEVHVGYTESGANTDLKNADSVLKSNNLPGQLVVGETAYNNSAVANGIKSFIKKSTRKVQEVIQWPLSAGSSCPDISENPPYSVSAYVNSLP